MSRGAAGSREAARPKRVRVGISGWRYGGWRGSFYSKGLRQKDELAYAVYVRKEGWPSWVLLDDDLEVDAIDDRGRSIALGDMAHLQSGHDHLPRREDTVI